MRSRPWLTFLLVSLFLVGTGTAVAKPATPLCFRDGYWQALWVLDAIQVGQRHWTVAGDVDWGAGHYVVTGAGYTGPGGSPSGMTVYTRIQGSGVWATINFNSESIPWPNANLHAYVKTAVENEELDLYYVTEWYVNGVAIARAACP